jgi:hypothetical protein
MNISTSCTKVAITKINDMVLRYVRLNGISKNLYMNQVIIEDIVVTNITDKLMAKAGFVSLEIAINEHRPKNLERMTL